MSVVKVRVVVVMVMVRVWLSLQEMRVSLCNVPPKVTSVNVCVHIRQTERERDIFSRRQEAHYF